MRGDLEALKTLVVAFGPREAARQLKEPAGTILALARRHKWKQAGKEKIEDRRSEIGNTKAQKSPVRETQSKGNQSPATALANALNSLKHRSTLGLATFSARAAEQASLSKNPLLDARKARDVASVHTSIWPSEQSSQSILAIGLLIGEQRPVPASTLTTALTLDAEATNTATEGQDSVQGI